MELLELELPDRMAAELNQMVRGGLYHDRQEVIRRALNDFLRHHASALADEQQESDIAWALGKVATK